MSLSHGADARSLCKNGYRELVYVSLKVRKFNRWRDGKKKSGSPALTRNEEEGGGGGENRETDGGKGRSHLYQWTRWVRVGWVHGNMTEKEREGERETQSDTECVFAGGCSCRCIVIYPMSPTLQEEKLPLSSWNLSLNGLKEARKMDRAQLHSHLWKTGRDKGGGGVDGGARGKASKSLRACVSLCIVLCVLLPRQHASVVASLLSVVVSSTTLLVPLQRLLDCSNQCDLKLWLMLILSRHAEPFSSACLEGMAL